LQTNNGENPSITLPAWLPNRKHAQELNCPLDEGESPSHQTRM
jgi:hypothetical protein